MKIVLTGAGGGHFYPLIAVAERIRKEVFIQKITDPEIYFLSDAPYDERALFDLKITFIKIPSGKLHVYASLETIKNIFKTIGGVFVAIFEMYKIYPDVVFAKGGYASFPILFAARILSIPVIVHESDTVAGRTTQWAGKFARGVALSYKEASKYFKKEKIALTGQPIRDRIIPKEEYVRSYPMKTRPVLFIFGGSQGSQRINESIFSILPDLLNKYDIVHQVGAKNLELSRQTTNLLLNKHPQRDNYFLDGFMDVALFYPKVDLVITRAGSSLFEIALWQLPSIIVPIPESISRDQRSNAYAYAETGAAVVLEENNISESVLMSTINEILGKKETYENMIKSCHKFDYVRNAADTIAKELISIALSHQ